MDKSSQPETRPALSQPKGCSTGGLRLRQCELYGLLACDFEYTVSQMTAPLFPPGKMMAAPSGGVAADSGFAASGYAPRASEVGFRQRYLACAAAAATDYLQCQGFRENWFSALPPPPASLLLWRVFLLLVPDFSGLGNASPTPSLSF